jgi:hypothetical protein
MDIFTIPCSFESAQKKTKFEASKDLIMLEIERIHNILIFFLILQKSQPFGVISEHIQTTNE